MQIREGRGKLCDEGPAEDGEESSAQGVSSPDGERRRPLTEAAGKVVGV